MSQPDWKSQKSKATGSATALKYALPIAAFVLLAGGMSLWFARSSQQPADSPRVDRAQLPAANQEQGATSSHADVTLTPAHENW